MCTREARASCRAESPGEHCPLVAEPLAVLPLSRRGVPGAQELSRDFERERRCPKRFQRARSSSIPATSTLWPAHVWSSLKAVTPLARGGGPSCARSRHRGRPHDGDLAAVRPRGAGGHVTAHGHGLTKPTSLTTMASSGPAATRRAGPSAVARSTSTAWTRSSRSAASSVVTVREPVITFAPSPTNARAVASPMPLPAPVSIAVAL